jgi:transposase
LITDATGVPLAVTLTGGNRNDVTKLIPLLQAVPPVRGKRGRPRRRPDVVVGDRGYDHDKYRRLVRALGVRPLIARRDTEHGSGLGTQRRVVERAFAHLHWFRRLRIRWEIRDDIHEAFLTWDARSSAGDACHSRPGSSPSRSSHSRTEGARSKIRLTCIPSSREVTFGSGVKSSGITSSRLSTRSPVRRVISSSHLT